MKTMKISCQFSHDDTRLQGKSFHAIGRTRTAAKCITIEKKDTSKTSVFTVKSANLLRLCIPHHYRSLSSLVTSFCLQLL